MYENKTYFHIPAPTRFHQSQHKVNTKDLDQNKNTWVRGFTSANQDDNTSKWYNYGFIFNGKFIEGNTEDFPETYKALKEMNEHYPIIMAGFSWLKPHSHIGLHRDGSCEGVYSIHLGLIVPENCILKVNGEELVNSNGRLVVFDDNKLHESWNKSDKDRVTLYIKSHS